MENQVDDVAESVVSKLWSGDKKRSNDPWDRLHTAIIEQAILDVFRYLDSTKKTVQEKLYYYRAKAWLFDDSDRLKLICHDLGVELEQLRIVVGAAMEPQNRKLRRKIISAMGIHRVA